MKRQVHGSRGNGADPAAPKRINKELGITILIVTHEIDVIQKICNRVAVMELGRVVEQGSVLDVFSDPQKEITKRFVKNGHPQ